MQKMSAQERLEATLKREKLDRVLIWDMDCYGIKARYSNVPLSDLRYNPKLAAKAIAAYQRFTTFDIVSPAQESKAVLKDAGVKISEPANSYSSPLENYFATPEEVDTKEFYDPLDPKQTPWTNKGIYEKVRESKKLLGDDFLINGIMLSTFSLSGQFRGIEPFLMDTLTDEALAKKVISKVEQLVKGVIYRYMEAGADIAVLADPSASEDLISMDAFKEFVYGPTKNIFESVKKTYDKPAMMHLCGDTRNICKYMPDMGADIFSVDSKVDLAHYKKEIGDKIVIAGAVPTITVLLNGKPDDVDRSVKECFEKAAPGGGYILSSACDTPKETTYENILAMRKAAEAYTPIYQ